MNSMISVPSFGAMLLRRDIAAYLEMICENPWRSRHCKEQAILPNMEHFLPRQSDSSTSSQLVITSCGHVLSSSNKYRKISSMACLSVSACFGLSTLAGGICGKLGNCGVCRILCHSWTTFLVWAENLRPWGSFMWATKYGIHPSPAQRGCLKSSESMRLCAAVMSAPYKKKEEATCRGMRIISCVGRQGPLHDGAL